MSLETLEIKSKLLSLPSHNSVLIETVQAISDNLRTIIVEHGVKFIGLFGPLAQGHATPDNTVDILVEFFQPYTILKMVFDLSDYLEKLLQRPINLQEIKDFPEGQLPPELIPLEFIDLEAIRHNPHADNPYNLKLITADEVIHKIQPHLSTLYHQYKVKSLELFGSVARNESVPNSDIDLTVEFTEEVGLLQISGLINYLSDLLEAPVDLGEKKLLKPAIRHSAEPDLIKIY